jgi:hypothetical protein
VNSSLLLTVPSISHLLVQPIVGGYFTVPRDPKVFVRTLQAQVCYCVLPIWNNTMFCRCRGEFYISFDYIEANKDLLGILYLQDWIRKYCHAICFVCVWSTQIFPTHPLQVIISTRAPIHMIWC